MMTVLQKIKLLFLTSICSATLVGCANNVSTAVAKQADSITVSEVETVLPERKVVTLDTVPTYEEVLFMEVPNSETAAKDFLSSIDDLDINVTHVTIKNYGYENYTLECDFTDDSYSILIYVSPEPDGSETKWYGQLKKNNDNFRYWSYSVKGI